MVQDFINKQFFYLFIFTLIFGLILYGTIGFDSIDEICAFFLLALLAIVIFKSPDWKTNRMFLVISGVFLFYLAYSFYINSNSTAGILKDFIVQFKPFLGFFAVYYLAPVFDEKKKKLLIDIVYFLWPILIVLGIISLQTYRFLNQVMGHPTFYAAVITALSLIFLFCSKKSLKNNIIFVLILATGLFSERSKFYGFFLLSVVTLIFFSDIKRIKINTKTIVIGCITCLAMLYVGWDKITLYFGGVESFEAVPEDFIARAMLYETSTKVLEDYAPFGSGFASFGSFASGEYYSELYAKYSIDGVRGLTKSDYSFVADTYFPCLAQFGYVGIVLFILFLFYPVRKSFLLLRREGMENPKYFIIVSLIIGYFIIESIADATFTSHRGFFMMMLLGLILSEQKRIAYEIINQKNISINQEKDGN